MRVLRITLRHFKGVEERTVDFATRGVTLLVGPNEVGKSSVAEAFDVLLRLPHDSKRGEILALKPVTDDVGPEVEAEISLGDTRFTYSKRWLKNPETKLAISLPHPEQLTGRDAHNRVNQLLDARLDRPLFDALRFVQGSAIDQHSMVNSISLIAALDRASSASSAEPEGGATLFERIRTEYETYFTSGGKPRADRVQRQRRVEAAEAELVNSQGQLDRIVGLGSKFAELSERIAGTESQLEECHQDREELSGRLIEIQSIQEKLKQATGDRALAESERANAEVRWESRSKLISDRSTAKDQVEILKKEQLRVTDEVLLGEQECARAKQEAEQAEQAYQNASSEANRVQQTLQLHDAQLEVDRLGKRIHDFDVAEESRIEALRILDANAGIESKNRKPLDKAISSVREAEAIRRASRPLVTVEPTRDLTIGVDGIDELVPAGRAKQINVHDMTQIAIGDVARVTISAQTDAQKEDAFEKADAKLADLVTKLGLDPADPMEDLNQRLTLIDRARQDLKYAEERRSVALLDLTAEQLRAKHKNALELAEGAELPYDPVAHEEAKTAAAEVAQIIDGLRIERDGKQGMLDALERQFNESRVKSSKAEGELGQASQNFGRAEASLQEARQERGDDEVSQTLEELREREAEARQHEAEVAERLGLATPEIVHANAENLDALRVRLLGQLDADRSERDQITGELRAMGNKELQADVDLAQGKLEIENREYAALERRARAAELLFTVFAKHREAARKARSQPYSEEVNRLARFVFGPTVQIRIDPSDFSVLSRTLDGTSVEFGQLSTGTREQLAVIAALACAILVDPAGSESDVGAPVILDDVLGFADPVRLKRLGPVFAEAAKVAQVVLMTASPERYASIGDATVVHFDRF